MTLSTVNGAGIFSELTGTGSVPVVLVHGSWGSHHDWDLVAADLAQSFRVLTFDRRGHSQSEQQSGQGSVQEDVADVAGLIEHIAPGPAYVIGHSFGASIALRLAAARPDLLRGLVAHEPPLFSLLSHDPDLSPMLDELTRRFDAVGERIAIGEHRGAAELFVETVAIGPGAWGQVSPDVQRTFVENAPTFLDELRDPEMLAFDLESISSFRAPALLCMGDQSPPAFGAVVALLADALPNAETRVFAGASHIPHVTHPDTFAMAVRKFIESQEH